MKKQTGWWVAIAAILALEILGTLWATWASVKTAVALMQLSETELVGGQVAITLILIVAVIWMGATLRGATSQKLWVRSSNFTIQVLMLAAATGVLQGILGTKPVGFVMLAFSLLGIISSLALSRKPKDKAVADPQSADE